ncbi:MAG TPA: 30S ribosomal protein S2 [Flavobacteriales bacterium]|jgi:small subunit ribosomal protein S2|nr:30S ribosomal protein S2 [Flavobacteriales bacterium]MBK7102539.1 30S ribosomal protein S2 [Flavobacteriales bacterium]MBK7482725.1 30S ribosomal protein S2 [Flavobacteriales bacterium]MBK7619515.1 30S ribosomal protein S2 [Flavobacteriales bacterium]MBK8530638.1 30S ribosomal protein S2 [Flavobacteriales bacterium]
MARLEFKQLLDAGVHFGHLKRKWNPNMAPYIFDEKKGIHIIDLNKTAVKLEEAAAAMKSIARSGKKVLFVATKKQAKDIVTEKVKTTGMPYVTERWSGGMLTNFGTIRRTIKKMTTIDRMKTDGTFENMSKRERLQVSRQREKMEKNLGSIADLTRLPSALFIVDIVKEHIAVAEARKLNIPTFAMVDTNSDPSKVDFPIPANDDATKSIELIVDVMIAAINEGMEERKNDKTAVDEAAEEGAEVEVEANEVSEASEASEETAATDEKA